MPGGDQHRSPLARFQSICKQCQAWIKTGVRVLVFNPFVGNARRGSRQVSAWSVSKHLKAMPGVDQDRCPHGRCQPICKQCQAWIKAEVRVLVFNPFVSNAGQGSRQESAWPVSTHLKAMPGV